MAAVFLKLLNLSISASWLVLAVLVLRLISKRSPKWMNVLLWGIVALRLVLPFSIESALSLIPSAETVSPAAVQFAPAPTITSGVSIIDNAVNPSLSEHFAAVPTASVNPLYVWAYLAGWVWLIGLGAMLLYALVSYLRLRRRVSVSLPIQDHIYLCDAISSPFILGVVKPRIYLPSGLDEVQRQNVLAHEQAHLARRDHWWKPLGFALLAVYWFNPVLWLAYALLCRDIELACDEQVLRTMDESAVKTYSTVLLACSMPRKAVITCPLAFGEVGVKERVRNALHYKKPAFWVVAASVAVCVVVAVCFLTDPPRALSKVCGDFWDTEAVCTYTEEQSGADARYTTTNGTVRLSEHLALVRIGAARPEKKSAVNPKWSTLYLALPSADGAPAERLTIDFIREYDAPGGTKATYTLNIGTRDDSKSYKVLSGQDEIEEFLAYLRGDAEKKPLDEASLREQLINALDSADAVYFEPNMLDSNQSEGPITDAKYVDEICSLLRQIEPANDVEWPAREERFILSNASFMLLSGHDAEDLATADCVTMTPRYYILTDHDNERTLIFVHNGGKSYGNENYQLIGKLPFTGLGYTIAMDRRLQQHSNTIISR